MKYLILTLVFFSLISCTQTEIDPGIKVQLIDLTGLDGCGWAFESTDGSKLEPSNLHEFEVTLIDSAYYNITYLTEDAGSICMVGEIIRIKTISPSAD